MRKKVEMELNFRENERVCDPETQTREVNYMHCTPIIIFTILPVLFNQVGPTSVPDMRPAGLHKFDQVCVCDCYTFPAAESESMFVSLGPRHETLMSTSKATSACFALS